MPTHLFESLPDRRCHRRGRPAATGAVMLALLALLPLLPLSGASAQSMAAAATPGAPMPGAAPLVPHFAPDPELLRAFGGKEGIDRLTDVFVEKMRADARLGHFLEKTKIPLLKTQLSDHLCQVLAGPCVYEGDSMKAAHADLKITKADSLRQVEILQSTMDERGIPLGAQNELLARLAPMYREIITR